MLKYPTYNDITESEIKSETATEQLYGSLIACLDKLLTEEEQIEFSEQSRKDIEEFLESLTSDQIQKIMNFTTSIPSLKYEGEFTCDHCNTHNEFKLQGIQDFF